MFINAGSLLVGLCVALPPGLHRGLVVVSGRDWAAGWLKLAVVNLAER